MTEEKGIFIKNIYYMLAYAFSALNQGEYENIAKEKFDNIHNLFAAILSAGVGKQLKQGLYREYVRKSENLSTVRGKIDIAGTIKNQFARKRMVSCEYDELSENNLLNQIIKTTVMLLIKSPDVEEKYIVSLKREMMFFSDIDVLEPAKIPWNSVRYQRNNSAYRMIIGICEFAIEGMLQTTESGEYRLRSFIKGQQMERLYEKFLLEYYAKECPQVKATAAQIPWALDDGMNKMLPKMQSDITLSKGSTVLIIDAKFYAHTTQEQFDVHTIHSNNLYQIFTYVKNRDKGFGDEPHTV